jgi:hypothetical protein
MKTNLTPFIAALAALASTATFAAAQSPAAVATNSPFVGTWDGKMNDLPGISLTIDSTGGKIGGVIVFYFQERPDTNSPWRVTAEHAVPLLAPRVDGKTLTFEVQHHICHDCAELGPNAKFRVEVAGPYELRLWKLDDRETGKDPGPGSKLIRRAASAAAAAHSPFAGTWEGKLNDHPGIDLKIDDASGQLGGTVVFYVRERGDAGSPVRVTPEDPVPLLVSHVEANTLTFEVQPHTYDDSAEPGPRVRFRMELAAPNEARLSKLDDLEAGNDRIPVVNLIRHTP